MSLFRVSPWVSYEPSTTSPTTNSDDIAMDAPQISTLREEVTPPPQPTRTSKFRVKLLVNENTAGVGQSERKGDEEDDEEEGVDELEDEEDQLIDDDDVLPSDVTPSKGKLTPKKKPARKKATDHDVPHAALSLDAPTIPGVPDLPLPPRPSPKKSPTKKSTAPKPKKPSKPPKGVLLPAQEDLAMLSEGYAGTAASSPVTLPLDLPSPSPSLPPTDPHSTVTTVNCGPYPVYPLPTKPFPVQPPPKIGTGFSPVIPLDKTPHKVRHWRPARREIKGIAGGRWFARTWVGEKDSDFARAKEVEGEKADKNKERLADKLEKSLPSGTGGVIKLPGSTGKKRGSKATLSSVPSRASSVATDSYPLPNLSGQAEKSLGTGSGGVIKLPSSSMPIPSSGKNATMVLASPSAAPSRASSVATDYMPISNPQAHATKAPTKMRMILAPESEGEVEVEMADS